MKFLKLSLISLLVCLVLIFSGTFSFSQPIVPNVFPPVPVFPSNNLCQGLQVLTAAVCPGDGIDPGKEARLARLINTYRGNYGLPPITLSPGLSMVANRHVMDLVQNLRRVTHGFSNCPYDGNNPQTYPCMWQAPQRLGTGYPGNGYEIVCGGTGGFMATPRNMLRCWQGSPPHNAVILSQGVWARRPWRAMGVAIDQGFAAVWFGEEPDSPVSSGQNGSLLELTNQQRAINGVPALRLSDNLTSAAQRHANDMANTGSYSHTGSDGSSMSNRVNQTGYLWQAIAENIHMGTNLSPSGAINAWMNSIAHRQSLLDPKYTEVGFGVANRGQEIYYAQVFGRPK